MVLLSSYFEKGRSVALQTSCVSLFSGGMNIYRGDITLTLGMIWMLIQKYQMRMKGKRSIFDNTEQQIPYSRTPV